MKENAINVARSIIYHPVNSRLAYDAVSSLTIIAVFYLLFSSNQIAFLYILLFPILFLTFNLLFGMYTSLKMSPVSTKVATIFASAFFTSLFLWITGGNASILGAAFLFVSALTSLPRILLNFSNTNIKNPYVHQILLKNAPILVVGGGGYIGSMLVDAMLKNNMRVRVFDKFLYGKQVFDDLRKDKRLDLIEGDATDLYSLTLAAKNAQAVVHLAGIVGDPASMVDDKLTRHMNTVSTRMIKETVKAFRIPKFIFASSCSVYGDSSNVLSERSVLKPLSPYARSKIDSEKELLQDTFDEFNPVVLRFATVFGHSRKPRFDLVFNLFVAQAVNTGFITLTGKKQWRPFIHVKDIAEAIIKTLNTPVKKTSRQIYNVGDDRLHTTIGQLAESVKKTLEPEKKIKIITREDQSDLRNYKVSFKKIREQLNFTCQFTIEDGIREIAEHFKAGSYTKPYTNVYYSALETTKEIKKEFYSESYQKTHFSTISH